MTDSPSVDDELSTRIARSMGYSGPPTPAEFASARLYLDVLSAQWDEWDDVLEGLIDDLALLPEAFLDSLRATTS